MIKIEVGGVGNCTAVLSIIQTAFAPVAFFQACGYEIYAGGTHAGFSEPTFYKMAKKIQ